MFSRETKWEDVRDQNYENKMSSHLSLVWVRQWGAWKTSPI